MNAAAGAAIPTRKPQIRLVALDKIHESPFNRRRTWGSLEELAASMGGGVGVLEPLLARPHPTRAGVMGEDLELVFRVLAKDAGVEIVLAKTAREGIVELVRKKDIAPVVKKAGIKDKQLEERRESSSRNPMRDDEKRRREASARKRVATMAVAGAVVAAAVKKVPGSTVWPFLGRLLIDLVGHDAGLEILKRRGVDTARAKGVYSDNVEKKLRKLLEGMTDDGARGLVVELAASRGTFQFGLWSRKDLSPALREAARFYSVDTTKIARAAHAGLAASKKAKKGGRK